MVASYYPKNFDLIVGYFYNIFRLRTSPNFRIIKAQNCAAIWPLKNFKIELNLINP